MSWTWLLPTLIAAAFGRAAVQRWPVMVALLACYGAALLVKLLCGYEFVSPVVLAAMAPIAYFGFAVGLGWTAVMGRLVAMVAVTIVAFALSVGFHATRFGSLSSGLAHIGALVEKRLYSVDPLTTAKEACADDFWQDPNCVPLYVESLTVNTATVLTKYAAPKYMLPWFARLEAVTPTAHVKDAMSRAAAAKSLEPVLELARAEGVSDLLPYLPRLVGALLIPLLLLGLAISLWRNPRDRLARLSLSGLSCLAPLSWFILAKGHSYIHVETNATLWFVTFIPTSLCLLAAQSPTRMTPDAPPEAERH
jgi:hypothetical protein